jgi:hypothetical protein
MEAVGELRMGPAGMQAQHMTESASIGNPHFFHEWVPFLAEERRCKKV